MGTITLPPDNPVSILNGPYSLTGRVTADGQGNLTGEAIESYSGLIVRSAFQGTYRVAPDGTLTATVETDYPGIGRLTFKFAGVLFDDGEGIRVTVVELVGAGLPPNFTGIVSVGTLTKQ